MLDELCGGYMSEIEFIADGLKQSTDIYIYIYINKMNKGLNPDNGRYLRLLVEICK